MQNPFTPTFGIVPPFLAGRSKLLADMRRAFENWPGDPNLSSILIGPRGSGKTALLSCIGDEARKAGWIVADSAAIPGMLEDILQQSAAAAAGLVGSVQRKHLTGIHVGELLGLEWEQEPVRDANWRMRMELLLGTLREYGTGLLITVDEVRADHDEMIQLASIYQLLIRKGFKLALVMAGIPANINDLLEDPNVTFLRRCRQHYLGRISDPEIEVAFRKTVESGGKKLTGPALKEAVRSVDGFPYMMQLVGFFMWEEGMQAPVLESDQVQAGISQAAEDFQNGVLKSTLRELSGGDIAFLQAMLEDEEISRLTEVAGRLKRSTGYASTYKRRMLHAGIIEEEGTGFRFAIPFFREYLALYVK